MTNTKGITLVELQGLIVKLIEEYGADAPVLISETMFVRGADVTYIRHMDMNDIKFQSLDMSAAELKTQFEEGVVIGYVPTVE